MSAGHRTVVVGFSGVPNFDIIAPNFQLASPLVVQNYLFYLTYFLLIVWSGFETRGRILRCAY